MPVITSKNNGLIISASKLKDKKYRDETGLFLLNGRKLFGEALSAGIKLVRVFASPENTAPAQKSGAEVCETDISLFSKLSDEKSPEGLCAVAVKPRNRREIKPGSFVLICDRLSDPGNVGAVLRSARAFGADTVVFSSGCADVYSQKVLRGAMGAVFTQNIITEADTNELIKELEGRGFKTYAAALHTEATPLGKADLSGACAVVIGSEGSGLSNETVGLCGGALFIEMSPLCESLNAAVAASLILYRRYSGTLS